MNKLFKFTATSLLVCGLSIGLPLQADTITATTNKVALIKTSSHTDVLSFTVQHSINGGEQFPGETIDIPLNQFKKNPLVFLKTLKAHFSKLLEKQSLPVEIDSKLDFVLSAEAIDALGKLPSITIKTSVNSNGSGKSDLVFPAYLRQVPEKVGKGLIDWKGLDAQFTFADKFENLNATVNIIGLFLEVEDKMKLVLGNSHFSGSFDSQFIPTQLDLNLNLPSLKTRDYKHTLDLHDLLFKLTLNKSQNGLELGSMGFQFRQLEFFDIKKAFKSTVKGFSISAKGEEQKGLVNYKLTTKIDKLQAPGMVNIGENSKSDGFVAEISFSNLDEATLLAFKKNALALKSNPQMAIMLLMENSSQILAQSPKIGIALKADSSQGNFDGDVNITLSGKEITSLNIPALIALLQANANINISKSLLAKIVEAQILKKMQKSIADENKTLSKEELAFLTKQAKQASQQQLQMFVGMKFLIDSGDGNYRLSAKFKDKKLNLNGKDMPFKF